MVTCTADCLLSSYMCWFILKIYLPLPFPLSFSPSSPSFLVLCLSPPLLPLSQVDVELARQIAGSPVRNKDVQKKMWLKVAQHVIKKEENIEK